MKIIEELLKILKDIPSYCWYIWRIERHEELYITLKYDKNKLKYCSKCWDERYKIIQLDKSFKGRFICPSCKYSISDKNDTTNKQVIQNRELNSFISYGNKF